MEDINNVVQRKKNSSNRGKICKEEDCCSSAKTRGFCKKHYTTHYRLGEFDKSIKDNKVIKQCIVPGCNKKGLSLGYCSTHKSRVQRHGDSSHVSIELHGLSSLPEYNVWENMRKRCSDKNNKSYIYYGARGIVVCERWLKSFKNFYDDMGKRPSSKHQIDRRDNDGNYEPSNCRWVLPVVNLRNRRTIKMDAEKVRSLRKDRINGLSISKTALKYNISKTNVKDIMNKKIWGDIK